MDEQNLNRWFDLVSLVKTKDLSSDNDTPTWLLEPSGLYSIKYFYKLVNFGGISFELQNCIWKSRSHLTYIFSYGLSFITKV